MPEQMVENLSQCDLGSLHAAPAARVWAEYMNNALYSSLVEIGAVIDMYAGFQLWGRSKIAGVVSVSVAIAGGVIIGGYLEILALAGVFVSLYIASSIVKIVALGFGWKHLGNG